MANKNLFYFTDTKAAYNNLKNNAIYKASLIAAAIAYVPALAVNLITNFAIIVYGASLRAISPRRFHEVNGKPDIQVDTDVLAKVENDSKFRTRVANALLAIFSPVIAPLITLYNSISIFKWLVVKNNNLMTGCCLSVDDERNQQVESSNRQMNAQLGAQVNTSQNNSSSNVTSRSSNYGNQGREKSSLHAVIKTTNNSNTTTAPSSDRLTYSV